MALVGFQGAFSGCEGFSEHQFSLPSAPWPRLGIKVPSLGVKDYQFSVLSASWPWLVGHQGAFSLSL